MTKKITDEMKISSDNDLKLINKANENGGTDNVSVIIMEGIK